MSFSVYAGEVVGIAGLIGSGRTEIAKIIFGALKRNLVNGGTIRLRGRPIRYRVPRQAIDDGIAYITEDRKANGFFETMIVDDNVYVGRLATRSGFSFLLSRARRSKLANYWVERLKINALQRKAKIVELSGGNQQKVVLAKSLGQQPSIIIFDEPTRGVDVGTIPHIHSEIRRLADEGKAVVVISSYLPEILAVSDRILVARTGRIVFDGTDITACPTHKIIARGIACIPEGRKVFPKLTVEENLRVGSYQESSDKIAQARLVDIYAIFPRLLERRNQLAGTMSGGEQAMVSIGRGLMCAPKLLLIDEPSLGLSPRLVKENFNIIRQINERGITVLLVEQNVHQTLAIAHFGYVLSKGRVVASGTPSELAALREVQDAYFGGAPA